MASSHNRSEPLIIKDSPDPVAIETIELIRKLRQHIADGCECCKEAIR